MKVEINFQESEPMAYSDFYFINMNKEPYKQLNFNPGGIPDEPDDRDYQWNTGEFGAALPPFDWNKGFDIEEELRTILGDANFKLKPNNQGDSLSCGGQAWSKYAAILSAVIRKSFYENSAKFIYSQIFYLYFTPVFINHSVN